MYLSGKILLPGIVLGVFLASCTNNDTTTGTGSDSAMTVNTDTMMTDHTRVMPMDSSTNGVIVNTDSMSKIITDTASKIKTDKKAKNVKITIVPAAVGSNTSALEMDNEGFYKNTEILPAYPGGQKALERFFEDNIVYPDEASENGTEGTVKLTFAVDENGKIFQPLAMGEKIGNGIEEEAIRVFNKMPKWTPGKIKGKNVKTRYTLPIRFQLY